MKKIILSLSTSIIIFSLVINGLFFYKPTEASKVKNNYTNSCGNKSLEKFGSIDRSQTININGIDNPLYCSFIDNEDAIKKIQNLTPEILSSISKEFSIDKISTENWEKYMHGMLNLPDSNEFASENNEQRQILSSFFDIYENSKKNEQIKNSLNEIHLEHSSQKYRISSLSELLPFYSPLVKQYQFRISQDKQLYSLRSLPNTNAAISYASRYAINPNIDGYGEAKGHFGFTSMDCTNFASQILEASGVGQDVYNSNLMGWWHRKNGNNHSYSVSWINSDTFARYMGVGFYTYDHNYFSHNINEGDFISYDREADGDWDHIGFVTDTGSEICANNGNYRNYKIAQHTENYHKWAPNTGWPKAGIMYARIRR